MTVGELAAYIAGLQAGYWARIGEENDRWRNRVNAAKPVFGSGSWMDRPTAAQRRKARETTLRDGHAAGLHEDRWPVYGCPVCAGGKP